MRLSEFLATNRGLVIELCQQKVADRLKSPTPGVAAPDGVPRFLDQLADTLIHEVDGAIVVVRNDALAEDADVRESAIRHGSFLWREGYTIDQVVHEYGDVCQSVTELAVEQHVAISATEFGILNRCLDDAIAGAVESYVLGDGAFPGTSPRAGSLEPGDLIDEKKRLVDAAIHAFAAIKAGGVGVNGATGALLAHSLMELRSLVDRALLG